ncbi:Phosphoglucosamine mutase [Novipirellula aureliae]|uniref:Phosphoglucosamine mutase n=1 Tax=Novipirellula aureliae TaxID=2527966 RepID=A0A5C6DPP7_9BACT|nr:phosphoglucosamine mutase [Novipirellula aureliae]TWU37621.1 Phosphoglucosamine mutase [Novipirellula aureliae]
MSGLIISVSGLRGIVGETLTPDVAVRFVAAFASKMPSGPILVGRDGRSSGAMLSQAILSALRASGRECVDCDVIATPTLGVLVRDRNAAGAVQISASHNPPPYNGIKLFGPEGRVLDAGRGAAIRDAYFSGEAAWCSFDRIGMVHPCDDVHQAHLDKVLATVDVTAIRTAKHRVLLDSNHGAGGILGKRLLEALACDIVMVGETPDGHFSHVPEPTAENLQNIATRVKDENCSVGFCQDPDADRLALIDADGRYIGEEFTVALCVQHALRKWTRAKASETDPKSDAAIVINGATSGMSERLAADAGVQSHRSAVGEANVADKMIATKAIYGGEGNGGPIDPNVGYVRDSFVGMAQVLDLMTKTGRSLAMLADALPQLFIYKTKAEVSSDRLPKLFESLIAAHPDASADTGDGLRLAWNDKWLLVRGSNTEPIVRLIAEAETMQEAKRLCESAAKFL